MTMNEWGKLNIDVMIDTNVILCNGHERCNLICLKLSSAGKQWESQMLEIMGEC